MSLPREIALSPDQLEDMMLTTWNIRIATHGPGEHINLTPVSYTHLTLPTICSV